MLERFVAVVGGMALPFLLVSGLAVVLVPHQPTQPGQAAPQSAEPAPQPQAAPQSTDDAAPRA